MVNQKDLESDLRHRFPDAFQASSASHFKVDCGAGWLPIIETLCTLLSGANRHADRTATHLVGAVEKMGTLRIMVTGRTPLADALIRFAEQHSTFTCEICGGIGKVLYVEGWQRVRCERHASSVRSLSADD